VKTVGILTRHVYPNYGSLLQGHALVNALTSAGARASIIDYFPLTDRPFRLATSRLRESRMRTSVTKRAAYLAIQTPNMANMSTRFRKFQHRHLPLTRMCADDLGVAEIIDGLDIALTGSDQIWNSIHGDLDPVYFLANQRNENKFSYAASFGSGSPSLEDKGRVHSWLREFREVSVRESSAQTALASIGIPSRVDVDPVLLHDNAFWNSFADAQPATAGRYILVYQLHNTPDFNRRLKVISDRHKLPIRRITPDAKMYLAHRASDYLVEPRRFVSLFRDADIVVTDSFHGTAFSLVFGKPLYALLPQENSTRNTDLLTSVGLDHLASAPDQAPVENPDYDAVAVTNLLRSHADDSWRYLRALLGEDDASCQTR